jgi:RNA polymerase sigma-70 factor (ECF subfamily)
MMITETETPRGHADAWVKLETAIEAHRSELTRYCTRRLGSPCDAEDAVQETLLRAWRSADRLHEPAALRAWLYRIAGNVCVDSVTRRARQPVPVEECSEPLDRTAELDPAELVLTREKLRLALAATVYHLPPRQRAVLLLREILCWRAAEVADFLATSVAAVNSALQRAHATLDGHEPERLGAVGDDGGDMLVTRYVSAFETDDVDAITALSCTRRGNAVRVCR